MTKRIAYLSIHFLITLFLLCGLQKWVFLIYNWNHGGSSCTAQDLVDIYVHGFALDMATAAYLTLPAFLLTGIASVLPSLRYTLSLRIANAFIALLYAIVTIADASLYEFWEFKLDATVFMYLNDPKNAFASVSTGYLVLRLAGILLLAYLFYLLLCKAVRPSLTAASMNGRWQKNLLLWLLTGGVLFGCIRGIRIWPNTPGRAYYTHITFFNHVALNPLFNLGYSLTKTHKAPVPYFSAKECDELCEGLFPTTSKNTRMLLQNKRPNVLFIVLEGFGAVFVDNLGGMKEVGIQVDRISRESVNFKQCYCSSFRTDRGIVSAISGYPGQPTTSIMRHTHKIKTLPGIPKTLKEYGYTTQMLYASDITFFNMSDYLLATGHDKLVSQVDFPLSQRTCKWGVPDHIAFEWLFNDIQKKHREEVHPWYTTFLTISSHTPFDVPYYRLDDKKLNGFAYTDSCFGAFIDKLKQTEAWDNLLILCSADHGYNHEEIAAADFPHIPFFLTGGAISGPCEISTLMSQTDIAATLLGQMGLPHDDFIFSRDIMSDTYTYPFAFNTFNDGFNFRDSTGCTVYDNVAKKVVEGGDPHREKTGKAILQKVQYDFYNR